MFAPLLLVAVVAATAAASGSADATPHQCGNTTTWTATCCSAQYSNTGFGCQLRPGGSCCMPGPEFAPQGPGPKCLVIGDSVSIGYTGVVAETLNGTCAVAHGAGATSYGQECLDAWLVTQAQEPVTWDVIQFNFGLHDLDHSASGEESYKMQLQNITTRLIATGAKLQYALTTPFMPLTTTGNFVVDELNAIASDIMAAHNIPIVDLHTLVTDHCGTIYEDCDWCRVHPCSYHYNGIGETAQGKFVAEAFRQRLQQEE